MTPAEPRDGGYAEDIHGDVWHSDAGSSVWRCVTAVDVPPMPWRSLVGTLGPLDVFVWRSRASADGGGTSGAGA